MIAINRAAAGGKRSITVQTGSERAAIPDAFTVADRSSCGFFYAILPTIYDKPFVRNLYQRLKSDGFIPWLDEEELLAGQDWNSEIVKAVRSAQVVVVCLSQKATTKAGFVQKEICYALDVAEEQPEGTIFLIPIGIDDCEVPDRLRKVAMV